MDARRNELDELLLEAALGEGLPRAQARARLAASADGRRTLGELEAELERARTGLCAVPGFDRRRERALVERVLASTTRAPARARSARRSLAFVAAAVLVLTGGALALRFGGRTPAQFARFEQRALPSEIRVADLRPDGGLSDVLALARAELETTADASGYARTDDASPEDAPIELRLLEARAKGLRERRWEPWLMEVPLAELRPLARALWCEVQLDRYVLSGARPPAWKTALRILEDGLTPAERAAPQSSRLLAKALARAHEYGESMARVADVNAPAGRLWTRDWFDDLEAAGREAGLADSSAWRAWVEWRGM